MQSTTGPMDEYAAAVAAERIAWEAVRTRLPGSLEFDNDLWLRWRGAVTLADEAAARAKLAAASLAPTGPGSALLGKSRPKAIQLPPISIRWHLPRGRSG